MILLCYDGSDDARAAVDRVARLFIGEPVTVLTVWEPFVEMLTHNGMGLGYAAPVADVAQTDAAAERQAVDTAREGCELLRRTGLRAELRAEPRHGGVAETINAVAGELDAEVVVVGTRGRGAFKSLLLGSVSHDVVQHLDRPLLIVPSEHVAAARGVARPHARVPS